jgi:cell division protein DivIC
LFSRRARKLIRFRSRAERVLLASVKVNLSIWDKLTPVVIFLLFIAGILLVGVWYLPLIKQNERMRREILRLDNLIRKEEESGRQLRTSIDSLRYDPKAVERLVRERLGYAKPGETVIRFEEPRSNSAVRR